LKNNLDFLQTNQKSWMQAQAQNDDETKKDQVSEPDLMGKLSMTDHDIDTTIEVLQKYHNQVSNNVKSLETKIEKIQAEIDCAFDEF